MSLQKREKFLLTAAPAILLAAALEGLMLRPLRRETQTLEQTVANRGSLTEKQAQTSLLQGQVEVLRAETEARRAALADAAGGFDRGLALRRVSELADAAGLLLVSSQIDPTGKLPPALQSAAPTLHTNNAASVVTRLIDMGMPAHLIGTTLQLCQAQRLVSKLCPHCRKPTPLAPEAAAALGVADQAGASVFEASGCLYCAGRGYAGRMGLFESLALRHDLSRLVSRGATQEEWLAAAVRQGFRTLLQDGVQKVFEGQTTVAEVLKAASDA